MDNYTTKTCLQCQKPILGRADKLFCDAQCRNAYHNRIKHGTEQYIKLINSGIRKNRRILKTLAPIGKAIVRKDIMDAMGYNFNHFSGLFHSSKFVYYMNYEYGIRALMDNGKQKVQIIQKQDYMDSYNPWKYIK